MYGAEGPNPNKDIQTKIAELDNPPCTLQVSMRILLMGNIYVAAVELDLKNSVMHQRC